MSDLFSPYTLGSTELSNRVVMAPMTRCRALGNVPNALMAEYYGSRGSAGLLISEGVAPSANGLGYARIPGLFTAEQIAGWRLVTDAVHANGGRIFAQIMHCGRVSHPDNMPEGAEVVAPSAIAVAGEMWTDNGGNQAYPVPREMTLEDIAQARQEIVTAAKNAIEAGFDGVEIHGANGYLIDQFLQPDANQRTDAYGGSAENRNRFALEVAAAVVEAIGKERTGIRISPLGAFNSVTPFEGTEDQYEALVRGLSDLGLVYLHLVDHSSQGAPEVPQALKDRLRSAFDGTFILSGGYDRETADADLAAGRGDLVAFGRPFLANPDLVAKLREGAELAQPEYDKLYTPGPEGFTVFGTAAE